MFASVFSHHRTLNTNALSRFLVILFVVFQSCIPNKELVYLQDKQKPAAPKEAPMQEYQARIHAYKVQHGDVLNIKVMGQDPVSVQPFNIDGQTSNAQMQMNLTQLYISGYTVDDKGNIQFPLLGDVYVKDKTIPEISTLLAEKIDKYVSNALVKVKLVSFKITVLGEVKSPGVHYIYNDRASILEVIGYAGDLTDLANRHNIKLIRTINNKVQMSNLDLTDRRLVEGNSFFLLPNDVLYVEPMKAKNFRLNLPAISLIISSLTTILVIINLVGK
jgi:polysaccharide export outer membrane protein